MTIKQPLGYHGPLSSAELTECTAPKAQSNLKFLGRMGPLVASHIYLMESPDLY